MKKILFLLTIIILQACEKPSDCLESSGEIINKEFPITDITRLEVYEGVEVIITEGTTPELTIQTGENILQNVEVSQVGNVLKLKLNSTCNWVRSYGITKAFLTVPNLEEIYSKTDRNISSNGVLTFPTLKIIALDKNGDGVDGAATGDFSLEIDNNSFEINNNSLSRYYISGKTNNLSVEIYNGDGRVEAQNFEAKNVHIYHRGSNDIIVKPIDEIEGKLVSTGNLILKNNPPIINLQVLYQGIVIYN